ncbi:adenosine receptor A3-like [Montipora foliosa]|uniref:adenosine receptor A3-like n=1 Tax=Montipora foliosa TaxID=591990 RepID=UPI0035F18331
MNGLTNDTRDTESHCSIYSPVLLVIGEKRVLLIIIVANVFLMLTASLGNVSILLSFLCVPSLRSTSNYLLFGLALSDLCVGLVVHPSYIAVIYNLYNESIPHCAVLFIYMIATSFLGTVSVMTITVIGMDKYLAIRLNLRYQEFVTERRSTIVLIVLWLTCGLSCLVWIEGFRVYIAFTTFVVTVSLFVICVIYVKLYSVVRRHKTQISRQTVARKMDDVEKVRQRRLHKSTINTLYVFFTFLVCYLPFFVSMAVHNLSRLENKQTVIAIEFAITLMLSNSSLNPLMYGFRLREFRVAVKKTYRILFCLPQTSQG